MFIGTFGIAFSFTCTFIYLTWYSMGGKYQETLESFNYMGLMVLIYFLTFSFISSELFNEAIYFYWVMTTFLLLCTMIILVNYKIGRTIGFWITVGWISLCFLLGLIFSEKKQIIVCYVPLIIEALLMTIAVLLVYFRVPERWC